ncbi:AMP-dependent synthetase/ligase [Pararhodobacter aggregans]|uniref:Long-chain fatty acid--CoA ligase n=1 Tax=Pararhodobacter aggregans TaxID=404875 RepID=A0A2T7UUP3_9RHOB|nr:long-chain fatty acid--CoA ligase [Pararhodobacter aggregans]PTX04151.1 long-chain acyl-CoA synthetase [Pararhodobacter aggregans]PVE48392.1 long-chain fatty acid--CoA ligase [Pararhodobacter aggregans]
MNAMNAMMEHPLTFVGHATPAGVFRARAQEWAAMPALRHKRRGLWQSLTWAEYYAQARALGLALADLGVRRGEVVAVLAENRPEWVIADIGAQAMGIVGNGIYPTASPEQMRYILQDSETRVLIVENQEQLEKALAVRAECPALVRIVVIDPEGLRKLSDPDVLFWTDLLARGMDLARTRAAEFEAAIDAGRSADLAFLVYTSGTTGAPKGAMISNANAIFQMQKATEYLDAKPGDKSLSFLPLCHIAERMASVFNPLALGLIVHFPENAGTVQNDLREVAPHVVFAPPRFWEKMHSAVELFLRDATGPARWTYRTALKRGRAGVEARLTGAAPPRPGPLDALLNRLAFRNIKVFLGLQNCRSALTGAAPVPPELIRWFLSIGIELREAFGMTETAGFAASTPSGGIRLGWAGTAAGGTEIRIAEEGEIQIRGPNVFAGYWRQADKTAETILPDGWLRTGDCGEVSPDGYLAIRDRIKDIIITAGGKNITPTQIESQLKFSPFITDAVVIGEGRRFLTALVMIDLEHVSRYAQEQAIPYTDFASLTRAEGVVQLIRAEIEAVNPRLARVEQIKDFRIIDQLLTAEDEELTPTMKLKRKVIAQKYRPLIDGMYPS